MSTRNEHDYMSSLMVHINTFDNIQGKKVVTSAVRAPALDLLTASESLSPKNFLLFHTGSLMSGSKSLGDAILKAILDHEEKGTVSKGGDGTQKERLEIFRF